MTSLEEFYRSLEMEADIRQVTTQTLGRTAQLTQKTNQFNLTTRRYTEQDIAEKMAADDWFVCTLRSRDKFGDNGIVGVAILNDQGETWEIDTFLLSCRVIGRTIETAILAAITNEVTRRGGKKLIAWFLPTKKNAPAKDFYEKHEFVCTEETDEGTRWQLDLDADQVKCPEWIKCKVDF